MWATVSINSEEAPCFVLLLSAHDSFSCLRVAGNQNGAAGARSAKCTLSVRDRDTDTSKYMEIHAEMVRTYQAVCCLCVPSTRDRKEKERDERIVIMCTSLKQIGTLISVSMMPVVLVFAAP